ncbi:MAG: hypothetical protein JNM63_02150 [Spirochaetia bacterium]|nr:hypothetical protein [Spirochaetia bacterium]
MRILTALIVSVLLSSGLWAATEWASAGFTAGDSRQEGERTVDVLKDANGFSFEAGHKGDLSSAELDKLRELHKIFFNFPGLKVKRLVMNVDAGKVEALVQPELIEYKGKDLKGNVPSGMAFAHAGTISYDFRMTQSNIFMKVRGPFDTAEALLKKMNEAVESPLQFIRRNDPEYFIDRLNSIDDSFLSAKREIDILRLGSLAYLNAGIFGIPQPIAAKSVSRCVEIRNQNPTWSKKQIADQLQKDNVKLNDREISIILSVFFNQQ